MLAELYHISKNLVKSGQEQSLVHVDFGEPGLSTKQNLKILIGDKGHILHLEPVGPKDNEILWTLQKGKFRFFPAVRIPHPLLLVRPESPDWEIFKKPSAQVLRSELPARLPNITGLDLKAEIGQAKRILKWEHPADETLALLKAFASSFLNLASDPLIISRELADALATALTRTQDDKSAKIFQSLFCGHLKEKKNKPPEVECNVQLIFDYLPKGELSGALYNPRTRQVVLECLNRESTPSKSKGKKQPDSPAVECSFEGTVRSILSESFPNWSAKPVFGNPFKPFSKFSDARCNWRYGKADAAGFSIGTETAKALVSAGAFVTNPANFGKTWTSIRNGRFEERNGKKTEASDVLIAYPSFDWGSLAPVSIIVAQTNDDVPEENENDALPAMPLSFTREAERFCQALKDVSRPENLDKDFIRLLVLRQVSPGQVQIAFSDTPTRGHFSKAVECWSQSANNLPPRLTVPLPTKSPDAEFLWRNPRVLFPEEAISVFSHQWMRDGTECFRIQSPPIGDIFDVFLQKKGVWQPAASRLLEALIPRVEPLLICAGSLFPRLRSRNDPDAWRHFIARKVDGKPDGSKPNPRYSLAHAISLIGTLLHALNSTPDIYMKETAFQIGKLLAMMDELHRCYCIIERDGSLPPTLIGNGLLGRAADSPEQALAELCERGRIYLGWAGTADPTKVADKEQEKAERKRIAINSARKLLRKTGPLVESLHANEDLGAPMGSTAKAHLFLGYLSPVLGGEIETPASDGKPEDESGATTNS